MHGWSRGKRTGGFVVESSWSAAACTARGMAQPILGFQQHPEPLPGVSPPQPLPCSSQSRPGRRAHSREWCWGMVSWVLTAGNGVLGAYASTQDESQRLQALLAARLLEDAPQGLSFPSLKMERVMLSVLQRENPAGKAGKDRSCHQPCWPWGRMGMGAEQGERVPAGRERQA